MPSSTPSAAAMWIWRSNSVSRPIGSIRYRFAAAAKHGVKTEGDSAAANAKVLAELASLIDTGRLEIPIAKVYHLADVREAYQDLAKRHTRGKIVLVP